MIKGHICIQNAFVVQASRCGLQDGLSPPLNTSAVTVTLTAEMACVHHHHCERRCGRRGLSPTWLQGAPFRQYDAGERPSDGRSGHRSGEGRRVGWPNVA